jgi:hypothetical protein
VSPDRASRREGGICLPAGDRGTHRAMTIGTSLFLIALGAILRYAVNDSIKDVDLPVIGLILMIAGAVGLVIGIWMTLSARRRYPTTYADPAYTDPAYRDPAADPPQQAPPAQAPPAQAPPPPPPRY